jgi:RHS repeat-associated protein
LCSLRTYTYDNEDQLKQSSGSGASGDYSYDVNGNRTSNNSQIAAGNRLKSGGKWNYEYDRNGNLISKYNFAGSTPTSLGQVRVNYTYDERNELTEAETLTYLNGQSHTQQENYNYSGEGRLMLRTDYDEGGVHYAYDGDNAVLEYGSIAITRSLYYGLAKDQILEQDTHQKVWWLMTDHQGSVRRELKTNGSVARRLDYDEFGNILGDKGTGPSPVNKFDGMRWDDKINAYLDRARIYGPDLGRFYQQDPLQSTANAYVFVGNNPLNFTDPTGMARFQANSQLPSGHARLSNLTGQIADSGMVVSDYNNSIAEVLAGQVDPASLAPFNGSQAIGDLDYGARAQAPAAREALASAGGVHVAGFGYSSYENLGSALLASQQLRGLDAPVTSVIDVGLESLSFGYHRADVGTWADSFRSSFDVARDLALAFTPGVNAAYFTTQGIYNVATGIGEGNYRKVALGAFDLVAGIGSAFSSARAFAEFEAAPPVASRFTNELYRARSAEFAAKVETSAERAVSASVSQTAVRTNAQLVDEIAARAEAWGTRKGLTGTAQKIGSAKHVYARHLLDRYQLMFGDRGLSTEIRYINQSLWRAGSAMPTKGSVILDAVEGNLTNPTAIYDYKFGVAGLSPVRINQIRQVGGFGNTVPVIEVRP